MRIGLFTDSFRPSTNGIVTVIEITRKYLEELGHEVYIFCPAGNFRKGKSDDEKIIRLTAVKGVFFDDYRTSLFSPPKVLKQIRELNLDVIHFFTPGQIGLMAVYAGRKTNTVTIAQHSTDVYQYIEHYPMAVPGVFLLSSMMPLTIKLTSDQRKRLLKMFQPASSAKWGRQMIEGTLTMAYGSCDAVVVLSRKSLNQIRSWPESSELDLRIIPTGIDKLPEASEAELEEYRQNWNIDVDDEVITYVGRLGSEKNLDLLIEAFPKILAERPKAKLMFVGDFEYSDTLKAAAAETGHGDRFVFTGMLPRLSLGAAYGVSKVFLFPSLTDTQGLVLHEATHAGLPVVMVDPDVSQVVIDGENGYVADNTAEDFAKKVVGLLADESLRQKFSKRSVELASEYTELIQTEKLVELYEELIERRKEVPVPAVD